jgi:predicted DCC family thiol-disulfide oxidoreductase YuxK
VRSWQSQGSRQQFDNDAEGVKLSSVEDRTRITVLFDGDCPLCDAAYRSVARNRLRLTRRAGSSCDGERCATAR